MCHDHLVNWPVSLSLISYFHKPESSLSIKLLATKVSVLLTKKSICHIPIYWQFLFQQDNAAIYSASITKNYLLEQKIRLFDLPVCSPDLSPIENLWGLIVAKVYEGGRQYSAISELKNAILDAWEKILLVQL